MKKLAIVKSFSFWREIFASHEEDLVIMKEK
jgi:hypothetical protein